MGRMEDLDARDRLRARAAGWNELPPSLSPRSTEKMRRIQEARDAAEAAERAKIDDEVEARRAAFAAAQKRAIVEQHAHIRERELAYHNRMTPPAAPAPVFTPAECSIISAHDVLMDQAELDDTSTCYDAACALGREFGDLFARLDAAQRSDPAGLPVLPTGRYTQGVM